MIAVSSINDSYLRKNADYIMDIIFSLLFKNNNNINSVSYTHLDVYKRQAQYSPRSVPTQVITLFALKYGYTKQIAVEKVKEFMDGLVENIQMSHPEFITEIETQKVISNELEAKMKEATGAYVDQFLKTQGAN